MRTPAGGIWTAAVILLALGVLTPYFLYIPQSALAAVIICAVLPMFEYEVIPKLFRVKSKYLMQILFLCFQGPCTLHAELKKLQKSSIHTKTFCHNYKDFFNSFIGGQRFCEKSQCARAFK